MTAEEKHVINRFIPFMGIAQEGMEIKESLDKGELPRSFSSIPVGYAREKARVHATGNRWAIENFHATHD